MANNPKREKKAISKRTLLLSHHGVKQCFHTMDVVVSDWATLEMGPVGLTSVKLASLMKNSLILVTKHCKKKKKEKHMRRRGLPFIFFPPPWLVFFFITPWPLKQQAQSKKKKKPNLAEKIVSVLRLDF